MGPTFWNESETLRCRVRWLNVAIDNAKEKYSDCKDILTVRDNTIKALRQSLKLTRQRCNDILSESGQREYLSRESLKWQHENNNVTE